MNNIQKYFEYRKSLISQYMMGDMTKKEYLDYNLDAVLGLNIKPFENIDTVEKGLFNYQYYNAMAKNSKMESFSIKEHSIRIGLIHQANDYYKDKDQATYAVLKLLNFENVNAYYIYVRSKYLKGKLYEIVLQGYDMIMHSINKGILNCMQREGIFINETRKSLIDDYINQKY